MKKILLGFTTTKKSDINGKIKEIKEFNLEEAALFLTGINSEERKELYSMLETTPLKKAPHVHLRNDMEKWEVDYLEKRFKVRAYNIHGQDSLFPFSGCEEILQNYSNKIYIENTELPPNREEMKEVGGLCIDFSHWRDSVLLKWNEYNRKMKEFFREFSVGCSHVSAVGNLPEGDCHSKHYFDDINEFGYMKNFIDYIPELISLELENSFREQIKLKEYLEKELKI
jgi:hypothetical protein